MKRRGGELKLYILLLSSCIYRISREKTEKFKTYLFRNVQKILKKFKKLFLYAIKNALCYL